VETELPDLNLNALKYTLSTEKLMAHYEVLFKSELQESGAVLDFIRGSLLRILGEPENALAYHQKACLREPNNLDFLRGLLSLAFFLPNLADAERFNPFLDWGKQLENKIQALLPRPVAPDAEKQIRVGYLSGDLNRHSLSFLLLGLLQAQKKTDFYWVIYSNAQKEDVFTQKFRQSVDLWRNVSQCSDSELANSIQTDKIDILVDLSGHTSGNRLEVFALKPAPIQVSGLGFGWTTGLKRIDYLFSDPWLVPPERKKYYSEEIIYLPQLFNWNPPESLLDLRRSDLPCLDRGYITLGYGNEGMKLNDALLDDWSEILKQLPQAKLALKFRGLENPLHAQYLYARFKQRNIKPEQLLFYGKTSHREHVEWYGNLDLALDPHPYQGGLSSLETLWMGVPLISLMGGTRAGVSILNAMGHPELLAFSRSDYIKKTVELAKDPLRLLHYRMNLRQTLLDSLICDTPAYAQAIQTAYRKIWQTWCLTQN
jgi:protein O-GlcNAc transferase